MSPKKFWSPERSTTEKLLQQYTDFMSDDEIVLFVKVHAVYGEV